MFDIADMFKTTDSPRSRALYTITYGVYIKVFFNIISIFRIILSTPCQKYFLFKQFK